MGYAWDLMKKILVIEPSQRLTAQQALAHPFFENTVTLLLLHAYISLLTARECHKPPCAPSWIVGRILLFFYVSTGTTSLCLVFQSE